MFIDLTISSRSTIRLVTTLATRCCRRWRRLNACVPQRYRGTAGRRRVHRTAAESEGREDAALVAEKIIASAEPADSGRQ